MIIGRIRMLAIMSKVIPLRITSSCIDEPAKTNAADLNQHFICINDKLSMIIDDFSTNLKSMSNIGIVLVLVVVV